MAWKWYKHSKKYLKCFYQQYWQLAIPTYAQALAYNSLLALVPVTGLVLLLLHDLGVTEGLIARVHQFILDYVNAAGEATIEKTFKTLTTTVGKETWGIMGLGALLYAYWGLVTQFGQAMDRIFQVRQRPEDQGMPTRTNLRMFIIRAMLVILLPIAIVGSIFVTSWVSQDSWIASVFGYLRMEGVLTIVSAWLLNSIVLAMVFYYTPKKTMKFSNTMVSAFIASAALGLAQYFFRFFTEYSITNQRIYGVFIAIPLLVVWIYISWLVILCSVLSINLPKRT